MIFENINEFTVFLSIILLGVGILFSWKNYIKNKNILLIVLFLFSVFSIIIALFSPRYGDYNKLLDTHSGKVLFAIDVSKSMDVYDIGYNGGITSRLNAEKIIIGNFIKQNQQNQYALFAFAAETLEILPYTSDTGLFQTILSGVDKNNVSKYGSEFLGLFETIADFIGIKDNAGTVVIFTDGGDDSKITLSQSIINKINKYNSKIIIIGLGTEKGGYIIEGQDVFGRAKYKIYNGEKVISKLNSKTLKNFSKKYDFTYYEVNNLDNLKNIYKHISENINRVQSEKNISLKRDISYIFIILFLGFFLGFLIIENIIGRK